MRDSIARVVDKLIVELEAQLDKNEVTIELEPAARDWIARKGYDRKMGARAHGTGHPGALSSGPWPKSCFSAGSGTGAMCAWTWTAAATALVLIPEPAVRELEHVPEV